MIDIIGIGLILIILFIFLLKQNNKSKKLAIELSELKIFNSEQIKSVSSVILGQVTAKNKELEDEITKKVNNYLLEEVKSYLVETMEKLTKEQKEELSNIIKNGFSRVGKDIFFDNGTNNKISLNLLLNNENIKNTEIYNRLVAVLGQTELLKKDTELKVNSISNILNTIEDTYSKARTQGKKVIKEIKGRIEVLESIATVKSGSSDSADTKDKVDIETLKLTPKSNIRVK